MTSLNQDKKSDEFSFSMDSTPQVSWEAVSGFVLMVFLSLSIIFVTNLDLGSYGLTKSIELLVVQLYCILIALGLFLYAVIEEIGEIENITYLAIILGLFIALVLLPPDYSFLCTINSYICLIVIVFFSIGAFLKAEKDEEQRMRSKVELAFLLEKFNEEETQRESEVASPDKIVATKEILETLKNDNGIHDRTSEDKRRLEWKKSWRQRRQKAINEIDDQFTAWRLAFDSAMVAWVVLGVFISFGRSKPFLYANPILEVAAVHRILDIRILITLLLVTVFSGRAIFLAFSQARPKVANLSQFNGMRLPDEKNLVARISRTLLIVFNAVVLSVQRVTNLIWYAIALFAIFIWRVLQSVQHEFFLVVKNTRTWKVCAKVLASFVSLLIISAFTWKNTPLISAHLATDSTLFADLGFQFGALLQLVGSFAVALGLIVFVLKIWGFDEDSIQRPILGAVVLSVAWFTSSIISLVLYHTNILNLHAFASIGIYSLGFIAIILIFIVFQLVERLFGNQQTR